jgi:hypothetical integral membrane protein (TIGR02206 family)
MTTFHPYSLTHALVVIAVALATSAAILLRPRIGRPLNYLIGGLNLAWFVCAITLPALVAGVDASRDLPLHACDISAAAAFVALVFDIRFARAILYYVGIGLSSWALWTPDLDKGPATIEFWLFFIGHAATVGGAVYDLVARGYRPTWRDFRNTIVFMTAWLVIAFTINVSFGWNYGYVGDTHTHVPNPIHLLGPWPWRVGVLFAAVTGLFAAMTWPWTRATAGY